MVSRFGGVGNAFLSESRIKTASTENTDKEESEEARERGSGEGESGFSRLKDFQDLRRENGRDLAPEGRYVYRPAGQTNTPKPQRGDVLKRKGGSGKAGKRGI